MPTLSPTGASARITAIDAVRGFALLGILLVNIHTFAAPFGEMLQFTPPAGASPADIAAFYFTKIFCEAKFYPLFSLLFGMGLALQSGRAADAGRTFLAPGFRRLGVLILLGFFHAMFLWYGDILFIYGIAGILVLLMARCRPRTLLVTAGALLGVAVLLNLAFGLLMIAGGPENASPPGSVPTHFDRPFEDLLKTMSSKEPADPSSPVWVAAERQAYAEGPYDQLFKFRAMTWGFYLLFTLLGFGWHVAAMMLIGAALLKLGLFEPHRRPWRRGLLLAAVFIGLPASALAATSPLFLPEAGAIALGGPLTMLAGPLLSLGYLAGLALLVETGRARPLTAALANVGRMALTNYLLQTLIATTIFYYYGFGLFGQTGRAERIGIALAIYLPQILFSHLWLSAFQFGPAEWAWRTLTYLRRVPLMRSPGAAPAPG